jgi:hypothetical protein
MPQRKRRPRKIATVDILAAGALAMQQRAPASI